MVETAAKVAADALVVSKRRRFTAERIETLISASLTTPGLTSITLTVIAHGTGVIDYGVRVSAYGISQQWLRRPRKRLRSGPLRGRQPSDGVSLRQSEHDQPQFSGPSTIRRGSGSALF